MIPAQRARSLIAAASGLPRVDPVPLLSGYYITTDERGRVEFWSMRRHGTRNVPFRKDVAVDHDGALRACFQRHTDQGSSTRIVRLCALAWHGKPPSLDYIAVCSGSPFQPTPRNVRWIPRRDKQTRAGRKPFRLNALQVASIKSRLAEGAGCKALAKAFGVNRTTIRDIKRGVIWREAQS